MFDLQGEVAILKSLREMPMELQKLIRRSIQTKKGKVFQLTEEDEPQRKNRNKSKPGMNRRRDRSADKLTDINGALDRMQELEAQNELILLEQ